MKKAALTGINKIEIIDAPKPEIKEDKEVLIKMQVMGICGSDIHYYAEGRIGNQVVEYPHTIGHEGAGIVEATGSKVSSVKPGDKIAVEPSIACGHCEQCLSGRFHTCLNNIFLGNPGQREGNLAEYIVLPESQCVKLSKNQPIEDGALSEPLTIGNYAYKLAEALKNSKIGILGFGPVGISVMLAAKAHGQKDFYVSEKIDARIQKAKNLGALATFNPNNQEVAREIKKMEPNSLDVVFECCGQQDAMDTALEVLKPGGKVIVIGIPEFDRYSFDSDLARRHELSIIHARRQNKTLEETLDLMASGKIDGNQMVTHQYKLEEVPEAFDLVRNYRDGVIKALIYF